MYVDVGCKNCYLLRSLYSKYIKIVGDIFTHVITTDFHVVMISVVDVLVF